MTIDTYLENSKSENYHLGKLFLDCMKTTPPEGIFQIDAATGEKETNASVLSRSLRLARCFRKLGLQPGDVLALGGKNHLDLHIPFYAALINGLPIAGVDPYFKYDEIKNLFKLTAPKIAFCQEESASTYEQAASDLGLKVKIVSFDGHGLTNFMDENDGEGISEEIKAAEFDTDKIYVWLVSTSGTTGPPKVAAFKHQPLIHTILGYIMPTHNVNHEGSKPALNLSPVQWISGYFNATIMPLLGQIKVQTSRADDIGHIVQIINEYRPEHMMAGPSTLSLILKHQDAVCDLTCFDTLTLTGSKVYKDLALQLKSRLSPTAVLVEAYGQTETVGPVLRPNPQGPFGNCGVPMPTHVRKIKLVDPETGDEVTEPNVPGELWTIGPSFAEYYNNPEATKNAFTEDGWYKTGDMLYRDEDNNFYFADRIKTLIKYRNYHINPNELEQVIARLEQVLEVAVVGVPHPEDGQHAAACLVLQPGATLTAQAVKNIVAKNLSPKKQLYGGVVFLDSLPKTSTGKVAYGQLAKLAVSLNRE